MTVQPADHGRTDAFCAHHDRPLHHARAHGAPAPPHCRSLEEIDHHYH